jgi:hypothetical protein
VLADAVDGTAIGKRACTKAEGYLPIDFLIYLRCINIVESFHPIIWQVEPFQSDCFAIGLKGSVCFNGLGVRIPYGSLNFSTPMLNAGGEALR